MKTKEEIIFRELNYLLENGIYTKEIPNKYTIKILLKGKELYLNAILLTKFGKFIFCNNVSYIEWLKNLKIEDLHIVENSLETLWNNLN